MNGNIVSFPCRATSVCPAHCCGSCDCVAWFSDGAAAFCINACNPLKYAACLHTDRRHTQYEYGDDAPGAFRPCCMTSKGCKDKDVSRTCYKKLEQDLTLMVIDKKTRSAALYPDDSDEGPGLMLHTARPPLRSVARRGG